jgi:hypothetical protein
VAALLLTDAGRTDTATSMPRSPPVGLAWEATDHIVREERLPVTVRLVDVRAKRGS